MNATMFFIIGIILIIFPFNLPLSFTGGLFIGFNFDDMRNEIKQWKKQ